MIRVAHVNQDPGIGVGAMKGAAVHVAAMRDALRSCGARVFTLDQAEERLGSEALEHAHAMDPIRLLYERYALRASAGARFCRAQGVPLVLEVNAPLLDEASVHRGRAVGGDDVALEREIFESASCIFAVSSQVAAYVKRSGVDPLRVRLRPNAVDSDRFAPLPDREAARRALGLQNRFVLGFHGRLRPWHGFERVLVAAAKLLERGVPVHVLTLGAGDFSSPLAAALPSSAYTALPWVAHESVPRTVGCFDALALAYSADAPCYFSPLKLLEAMAAGAVPVVPALGDLPALVRDGHDGLFYAAQDDDGLFRALHALATQRGLRERLAAHAVQSARGRSWVALAREVLSIVPGVVPSP